MTNAHWSYPLYRMAWSGLDWLFPPRCGGCGKVGSRWCDQCQKNVPALCGDLCEKCGLPISHSGMCDRCRVDPPPYCALRSWAAFDIPVRQALHKLKYRRDMGLGDALAVPLGRKRMQERGYNQTDLIAHPLSLALGLNYRPGALKRKRETISQVGLSAVERRDNMQDAFLADPRVVRGRVVLVVDDVATTGSTLSSCSEALLQTGAADVYALTVARALPHHGLHLV